MEIGQKIKQLRYKAGLTQEQLAERLGVSAQSVSKWENAASMPDISLLPLLSEAFGVSIDELFDLTQEQKMRRIESRMDMEEELAPDIFADYEEFLRQQLLSAKEKQPVLSLLAHLYHHRMEADARRVSRYAREALGMEPGKKDCQWLLTMAEGAAAWDWNVSNHGKVIELYKELIKNDHGKPTPGPYYYLLDNLIADHRTEEAKTYLKAFQALPGRKPPFMAEVYQAHIALAEYDEPKADAIMEEAARKYGTDSGFLFEAAQYHAKKCEYEEAIRLYEKSYASEEARKPRLIDALEGIAIIHEIMGDYGKAAQTYDRILENLRQEWGFTDEVVVQEAEKEKNRLLQRK